MHSFIQIPPTHPFSLHNLPYAVFSPANGRSRRVGVAIGDYLLDLAVLEEAGYFRSLWGETTPVFARPTLNPFMALGYDVWQDVRQIVQQLLPAETPTLRDNADLRRRALRAQTDVRLHLPADIGDYTDFYSSKEHASNVGAMFRNPDKALLPNWVHLPVAYHGRASSIVPDGTPIRRPLGQTLPAGATTPEFGPSQELDFELEVGFFVGPGNPLGQPISVEEASRHIFGFVLVNDWSARDVQRWEYRPLGPFLAKSFATSISPWVVPLAALEPFRCPGPVQAPPPLPYLQSRGDWAFDVHLAVQLQSEQMAEPVTIARSNMRHLYWNVCQQLAHHSSNGCNLRPGDLLATGTISGPTPDSYGSLLELSWRGTRPLTLPNGEKRTYLADGDRLTLTGWAQGDGYRVGLGQVSGQILPAHAVG
jgi:fumarylacetoacetase